MSYPASLLITRSFYTSGIVARNLEIVSGDQISDGLFLLNELLDLTAADTALIPYWKRFALTLVPNQEMYFLQNVYQIETFTFNIGPVRFPTSDMSRKQYFGNGRVDNVQSLPFSWHLERTLGGSNLFLYYLPQQAYAANITAKFALTDVVLNTDLTTVYDSFYTAYLRYALAEYICQYYDIEFPADKKLMLTKLEKKLSLISPQDLTLKHISFLNTRTPVNWALINIPGWVNG